MLMRKGNEVNKTSLGLLLLFMFGMVLTFFFYREGDGTFPQSEKERFRRIWSSGFSGLALPILISMDRILYFPVIYVVLFL